MHTPHIHLPAILLISSLALACSKDDKYLSLSDFHQFSISETLTTDNDQERIQKTEAFQFLDGQLQASTVTQVMPGYDNYTTTCQYNLAYTDEHATVTSCASRPIVYTLNEDGLAASCEFEDAGQIRRHEFTYKDGLLGSVTEIVDNTKNYYLELFYEKKCLVKTTETGYYHDYTCHFTSSSDKNVGQLPVHYLTEAYPLSFHKTAIYAGLLGEAPPYLIQQITQESTPANTVNYAYKFSNNYIIECQIEIIYSVGKMRRLLKLDYNK